MFDAIAQADPRWRVFRYVAKHKKGVSVGYVNTRQGDRICALWLGSAVFIRGYNEESPLSMTPANALVDRAAFGSASPVPRCFRKFREQLQYECGAATFCVWRTTSDRKWHALPLLLESQELATSPFRFLEMFTGDPGPFADWVAEYYERDDLGDVIRALYQCAPLETGMVLAIRSTASLSVAIEAARAIEYPLGRELTS